MYLNNLSNYNRIVNQRNRLLKELSFGGKKELSDTLEIWEMQQIYAKVTDDKIDMDTRSLEEKIAGRFSVAI